MALSANTVWEVRTAGTDTNGGGFVTGAAGADYSLQDAKNTVGSDISTTDAVAVGTTTITSATANFGTTIVGNIVYFQGGTGTIAAQWRQVTARASTTSITIDTAIAASTGMTLNIGGALASPGQVAASVVNGNIVFIKSGTYSITSASTNVAAGCLSVNTTAIFVGYSATRTRINTDTKPVLQLNVSTGTIFTNPSGGVYNVTFDGNSQTTSKSIGACGSIFNRCSFINFTATSGINTGMFLFCSATGCSGTAMTGNAFMFCEVYSNTAVPIAVSGSNALIHGCLSYNNTGATTDGFLYATLSKVVNCIAYGNGRHGIGDNGSGANQFAIINCHCENNGGFGLLVTASSNFAGRYVINFSHYNNTSGGISGATLAESGTLTPTGSVFTNAGGTDFSLNNTASQGALLRAASFPALFPVGLTANYRDIGAAQHLENPPIGKGNFPGLGIQRASSY